MVIARIKSGEIIPGSKEERDFQIYQLFFLLGFNSLIKTQMIPIPLMRIIHLALGAKLGENSYSSGVIHDPMFVTVGKNCILGDRSQLIPHAIEGQKLSVEPITIGDNVTIGANAIIFQNVKIGNNAIIAAGAIVPKGTIMGEDEIWGGIPAKFIKKIDKS